MAEKLYLYPVWLRSWHGLNALLFLVLILTGVSMQYSNPEVPLIRFDWAVKLHNIAGIIIVLAYVFFVFFSHFTKNKNHYHIDWKGLMTRLVKQARYYFIGVFKKEDAPFPISENMKFNPLQQLAYVAMMYVVLPLLIITGLALMFPELVIDNVFDVGGTLLTALFHSVLGFIATLFMVVHIYFCTMGSTYGAHFKSMINGWAEKH